MVNVSTVRKLSIAARIAAQHAAQEAVLVQRFGNDEPIAHLEAVLHDDGICERHEERRQVVGAVAVDVVLQVAPRVDEDEGVVAGKIEAAGGKVAGSVSLV